MRADPTFYSLSIPIKDSAYAEILIALFDSFQILAFEETEMALIAYHDDRSQLQNALEYLVGSDIVVREGLKIATEANKNWNAEWEASFEPIHISNFCRVRASFHQPSQDCQFEIVIDPQLAFGTGHHETTALMIKAMSQLQFEGKRVLDYGCGTAILAILADKMSAMDITAIDYDLRAVECAHQCILLNQSNVVDLSQGELKDISDESFDIVLANINRNVLSQNAEILGQVVRSEGILLISGILTTDRSQMLETFAHFGFAETLFEENGEWVCIQFEKVK